MSRIAGLSASGLDARPPARQYLRRTRDAPPPLGVEPPARRQPQLDRIAQALVVDAGPAVDRAQHRHRLVGPGPAVPAGDQVEPVLHVLAGDRVQPALDPVAEIDPQVLAVEADGVVRAVRVGLHVGLEGLGQGRHAARLGPLARRVLAPGDPPEQVLRPGAGLVGGDPAEASDDDALVGRLAAAVAGTVVDDEGLGARGLDAAAESDQLVVPCDPGLAGGLQRLDGALGEGEFHPGHALCGVGVGHGPNLAQGARNGNTTVNT